MLNDLKDYQEFISTHEIETFEDSVCKPLPDSNTKPKRDPKKFAAKLFEMRGKDENQEYYEFDHSKAEECGILLN